MSSSGDLTYARPEDIDSIYPKVREYIESALDQDGHKLTHESILEQLKSSGMLLWLSIKDGEPEGCCVTEIVKYPAKTVMVIVLAGGENMNGWNQYLRFVEKHAHESGCDYIEIYGRSGWEKILPEYKKSGVILRKTINGL